LGQAAPEDLVAYLIVTGEVGLSDAVSCPCPGPSWEERVANDI